MQCTRSPFIHNTMVRLKHRFIIAQIIPEANSKCTGKPTLSSREVQNVLREKIQELYGDVGLGEFGQASYIRYFDAKFSNIFIVKTTRDAQVKVHFALSCISNVSGTPVLIRSLSINSCPRTCMQTLKQLFRVHFENADFASESDRVAACSIVDKNLLSLEL